MLIQLKFSYRKCNYCLRKGEEHWMHGNTTIDGKFDSVSGDYCKKHKYIFDNKCKDMFKFK